MLRPILVAVSLAALPLSAQANFILQGVLKVEPPPVAPSDRSPPPPAVAGKVPVIRLAQGWGDNVPLSLERIPVQFSG